MAGWQGREGEGVMTARDGELERRQEVLRRMTGTPDDGSYDPPDSAEKHLAAVVLAFDGWMQGEHDIDRTMLAVAEARIFLTPPNGSSNARSES